MLIEHPLKPIYDKNSIVLILGSFPSVKSREKQFYYSHPQNRFPNGNEKSHLYIKRVIGVPGDTVQIKNGTVYVNGKVFDEKIGNNNNDKLRFY